MKKSENILILGLGGVGFYLAKRLSHEGHAITAIEQSRQLIRRADGEVDARLIRGDALSFSTWGEANAAEMDYLIAVTDNDSVNILGSLIAERCGVGCKIARVRSLELWDENAILTAEDLKIDLVIRPEELTAQEIARLLTVRAGNVVFDIAEGQMQVVGMRVDESSPFAKKNLKELSKRYDDSYFRVVSIARGINTIIPSGDEELRPGDNAYLLTRTEHVPRLMEATGVPEATRHRVLIIGGGLVGSRVAQLLESTFPVRLLERDEQRAEELTHSLENTEILHGDGSKRDVLLQAGLLDMDTVVAATGENETNIMSCVLARSVVEDHAGADGLKKIKTIALVGREEYLVLASTMGSDIVLSKKILAANEILKYIRRGQLLSVAHLHGFEADVVEMVVGDEAPITRKPLYQIDGLKGRIILGGYARGETWQTAVGSTQLMPGDLVLAVCKSDDLREAQRLILG
jgi:trk system potassium uptake protein TrkA